MKTFGEWCEWFAAIERNPTAKVTGMTIRLLMQARLHLDQCPACEDSYNRVMSKAPPEDPMNRIGFN